MDACINSDGRSNVARNSMTIAKRARRMMPKRGKRGVAARRIAERARRPRPRPAAGAAAEGVRVRSEPGPIARERNVTGRSVSGARPRSRRPRPSRPRRDRDHRLRRRERHLVPARRSRRRAHPHPGGLDPSESDPRFPPADGVRGGHRDHPAFRGGAWAPDSLAEGGTRCGLEAGRGGRGHLHAEHFSARDGVGQRVLQPEGAWHPVRLLPRRRPGTRAAICLARSSTPACRTTSSSTRRRTRLSTGSDRISPSRPIRTFRRFTRRSPIWRRCFDTSTHREVLLDTIQRTGGVLYRYHLRPDAATAPARGTAVRKRSRASHARWEPGTSRSSLRR